MLAWCELSFADSAHMCRLLPQCTPHPTSPLLHYTHRWSDRPHIATQLHYEKRLFAELSPGARVSPEQE